MKIQLTSCRKVIGIIIVACLMLTTFISCQTPGNKSDASQRNTARVQRGTIIVSVTANGKLDMPHEAKLHFATLGTVKKIFVTEGAKVKAGTLLAKLDDTAQKIAVASAQYSVELAMNELFEKINPSLMGYPNYYPDVTSLLRLEQAQKELEQAQELLGQGNYGEAAAVLRIAQYDLEASQEALVTPVINVEMYPDIPRAINLLEQDQEKLAEVQTLMEQGSYVGASAELVVALDMLGGTHQVLKGICGVIASYVPLYPDTSTSLDLLRQVEEELKQIQKLREQGNYDEVKLAEMLRMAQHDLEMSHNILENNELVFKHGLNLKVLRQNNLNLQKAEKALQSAKEELIKTELLAPFDGTVVEVSVKENDQLSAVDYSSRTVVHLVDTTTIEMDGVVNEIDIRKFPDNQINQSADIVVDASPSEKFKGKVIFVSPYATSQSGVTAFPVKISLEPTGKSLQGGLAATANIIVNKRENVLLIPNGAVKSFSGDSWVEAVTNEITKATEKRMVVLGARGKDLQGKQVIEVISGLKEGEKVIFETLHQ